jgi:hydroxymethylbilane synthase
MTSPYHCPLRVGTRGSPLALAQARQVAGQLRKRCGRAAVLVAMATPGDGSAAPIERLGTTGVFTTTLRAALLRGEVDLVVHSCKDLPAAPVSGLQVAAFPAREDPRDALIWPGGTGLETLPRGARIGTGSPRRAALLRATGRQLRVVPMRGNVGTRLRKLADGEADALVLAMAGLSRLGLSGAIATPLDPSALMPAPAQGVLALAHPGRGDHRTRIPGRYRGWLQRSSRRPGRGCRADRSRTSGPAVRSHRRYGWLRRDPRPGHRCRQQ